LLRRWIVDPKAGVLPGWSHYSYALNNPVLFLDPYGEYPICNLKLKGIKEIINDDKEY
jgi:hypothetical protein